MKKINFLLIVMLLLSVNLKAQFAGGDGTFEAPFEISTATHLNNVRNYLGSTHIDKYFKLMNDIDLTDYLATGDGYFAWGDEGWLPIGTIDFQFQGKVNGNGNKITNIYINRPDSSFVALFGYLGEEGIIENIGIEVGEDRSIRGENYISVLCGKNCGILSNCYANGITYGNFYLGLLSGYNTGTISNSFSTGEISGNGPYIGGLVGRNDGGTIINSYSATNIISTTSPVNEEVGAFVGKNFRGKVINCYATGSVYYLTTLLTDRGFSGGYNEDEDSEMSGNFWDMETSGSTTSLCNATGKTTLEMKRYSTFTGWNFDKTWSIISNDSWVSYPYLSDNAQNPVPGLEKLFNDGDGSPENPFEITTAKQLNNLRYFLGPDYANVYFELYNDIDLTEYLETGEGFAAWGAAGWLPIGIAYYSESFYGKFDGMGNTITGLWINRPETEYIALFGCLKVGSVIENLGLEVNESKNIYGNNYTGALCDHPHRQRPDCRPA